MREKLKAYLDLLFAGAPPEAADAKEEVCQNTLDKFDDFIDQGKTPEAAYSLAIAGLGDVSEILCAGERPQPEEKLQPGKSVLRMVLLPLAVALYIACPIPVIVWPGSNWSVAALLAMVAIATACLVLRPLVGKREARSQAEPEDAAPRSGLYRSVMSLISVLGVAAYFMVSFATGAWHITWVIFLMIGAVRQLVTVIFDWKEQEKE